MNSYMIFLLVFTMMFYFLFFLKITLVVAKGANPLALGKGKKGLNAILECSFILVFVFWTYQILTVTLIPNFQVLPDFLTKRFLNTDYLSVLAIIIMSVGLLIFIGALVAFKNSWRVGIDTNHPGPLVTSRIFSISRNPMFLFIDLYKVMNISWQKMSCRY